ncbi:MAG: hypothetical protein ACK5MU_04060 [Candidatus Saccharimonadales bacterium]
MNKYKKAAITKKRKYGDDYYSKIGKIGGQKGWPEGAVKGFAHRMRAAEKLREAERRALEPQLGDEKCGD